MIKVLLVDDHKIIREGIKALLNSHREIEIAGECDDGSEVDEFLKQNSVDLILMDINMPGMNGIKCTEEVVRKYSKIKVLALSMHNEEKYVSQIINAGASGYVLKDSGKKELIEAIQKVAAGNKYYDKEITSQLLAGYLKDHSDNEKPQRPELTKRELEILRMIADELTNNEIGEKLQISARTVDTHRRNLLQKLGVKNTVGLIRYAFQNGLIK